MEEDERKKMKTGSSAEINKIEHNNGNLRNGKNVPRESTKKEEFEEEERLFFEVNGKANDNDNRTKIAAYTDEIKMNNSNDNNKSDNDNNNNSNSNNNNDSNNNKFDLVENSTISSNINKIQSLSNPDLIMNNNILLPSYGSLSPKKLGTSVVTNGAVICVTEICVDEIDINIKNTNMKNNLNIDTTDNKNSSQIESLRHCLD